ncbi:hypothetical protein TNCV_4841701 [Trichonephila clavipes]|uniref:Uncharacterized protein n=1 Tax=Trichonephila clavipes TaxID=2585209 RepID=A0A8X7BLR5_TRICX|nr:hypothetical protein TNCV_4841701 [Trichonephila clavipes]
MRFAIERLFFEENREMFRVPGKRSLYRKIRNIGVRYIECPKGKRFSEAVLRFNSASEKKSPAQRSNWIYSVNGESVRRKVIFGSRAALNLASEKESVLLIEDQTGSTVLTARVSEGKAIFGNRTTSEFKAGQTDHTYS